MVIWNGSSWVEFYSRATYNSTFGISGGGLESGFAQVSLLANGRTYLASDNQDYYDDWVLPNSIAQSVPHWVRARDAVGNTELYSGPSTNTWNQLNTDITWNLNSTYSSSLQFAIDISLDSIGNNIVSTGFIVLGVDV